MDQAQNLMLKCDQLKEERDALLKSHARDFPGEGGGGGGSAQEKLMEVCEVCGAFLIVGDAQQRIEDHLSGKQHLGYAKLRRAVEKLYEQRRKRSGIDSDSGSVSRDRRREGGIGDRDRKSYRNGGSVDGDRRRTERRERDAFYSRPGGGERYDRHRHRQRDRGI